MKFLSHRSTVTALAAAAAAALAAPAAQAGKADNSLVWSSSAEVTAVDPFFDTSREVIVLAQHVHDGLVYWDPATGDYLPLLASAYRWVDSRTLEFDLRQGVTFHDGSSFGPEDVAYTINFGADEANGVLNYGDIKWLDRAEVVDADTVRILLDEPFPSALAYLALTLPILPEGHYDAAPVGTDGKKRYQAVPPVGTGPYKVTSFKAGDHVDMVANGDYFADGPKGTPAIERLTFRTITDDTTQIAELMTGGVDWIWGMSTDQAQMLKQAPNLTVLNAPTMRISYLTFDIKGTAGSDAFTKPEVRRAFAHAVNRENIAKNLMGESSQVIAAACHPTQFGCAADIAGYDYDPAKARALLAEAGYPDGLTFEFYGYRDRQVAEAIASDLAAVGMKSDLRWLKYAALRDMIREGKVGVANMTWGSSSIPDVSAITSYFFGGGPDDPAKDPDVMAVIARGDSATDPAERRAAYAEALAKIAEAAYWVPLFTYTKNYAFSADLQFAPTPDELPRFFRASWK